MQKLVIFDGSDKIATITKTDRCFLIFARSSREWSEMKRISTYVDSLKQFADKAHDYNYSTELI